MEKWSGFSVESNRRKWRKKDCVFLWLDFRWWSVDPIWWRHWAQTSSCCELFSLWAFGTGQSPWPVTSESNPFHSSEIARPLGNVDSPTDVFLRRVLYNRRILPSVKKKTGVSASFKAMTSRPFEARSDLLLRDSSTLVLVSQCPRGCESTKYDGQQKW